MYNKSLCQFLTIKNIWLKDHIKNFILKSSINGILDPFAGNGDLLETCRKELNINNILVYDIDKKFKWKINDSLINIEKTNRLIITNPPFLAKNIAKRLNVNNMIKYFNNNSYNDIYQIALFKCLEYHDKIVAIVPETFILSNKFLDFTESITILEENPFLNTQHPVCIICLDKTKKNDTLLYKNNDFIMKISELNLFKMSCENKIKIKFNDKNGNIGLRAIDGCEINNRIRFCFPNEIKNNINISSRSLTIINVEIDNSLIPTLIKTSNNILENWRKETFDLLLAAFKNNNKNGIRRRKLDFKTARCILEKSINKIV